MSDVAINKLKHYLKPIETDPQPDVAPIVETVDDVVDDEPSDDEPDVETIVPHLHEIALPDEDEDDHDIVESVPPIWDALIERLEAIAAPSPLDQSLDKRIRQLYALQEKLTNTVMVLAQRIDETAKPSQDTLIEQVTGILVDQQTAMYEQQRDMVQSITENQSVIASVMTELIEKVNAIATVQPIFNVPAPIVNVEVKEGGSVITKTIESDERGLISKVTEGRS